MSIIIEVYDIRNNKVNLQAFHLTIETHYKDLKFISIKFKRDNEQGGVASELCKCSRRI